MCQYSKDYYLAGMIITNPQKTLLSFLVQFLHEEWQLFKVADSIDDSWLEEWFSLGKSLTALIKLAKTYCLPVSAKLGKPQMKIFCNQRHAHCCSTNWCISNKGNLEHPQRKFEFSNWTWVNRFALPTLFKDSL